jgi:hypothetical protein
LTFHSRNKTGKAGERLVETFVEEKLNFVYRRIDTPDIGIDGEIETLAPDRTVTGGFLKVQVKTTEQTLRGKRFKVPFDEEHLDYFDALTVPPILAVVSLADQAIWWKPILHKETYRGPRDGFGIPINTTIDELTASSTRWLRMIAERSNAIIARYLLEEVEQKLTDMDDLEEGGDWDYVTADIWAQTVQEVDQMMHDAACLLKYERRYSAEITEIENRHKDAGHRITQWRRWFKENGCSDLLTIPYWGDKS